MSTKWFQYIQELLAKTAESNVWFGPEMLDVIRNGKYQMSQTDFKTKEILSKHQYQNPTGPPV